MEQLERIDTSTTDKLTTFQKNYNITSKKIAAFLGKNLTLFICLCIPALLIGFVWTDVGWPTISAKLVAEGVLTVALLFVGEVMATVLGTDGGRLDEEFVSAKSEFNALVAKVGEVGTFLLGVFCDWQTDIELDHAIKSRLRILRIPMSEWDKIKNLAPAELEARYGKKRAKKLLEIIELKPIELNEAILLYNGEYTARGDVPKNAEQYLNDKRNFIATVLACVFTGLFMVSIAMTLTTDITIARVIFTIYKLVILFYRMAKGYARGAKAYNTVEVRRFKAVCNYLKQYLKFMEEKIYLGLDDKYGDISMFVTQNTDSAEGIVEVASAIHENV